MSGAAHVVTVRAEPGRAYVLTCSCGWSSCVEHGGIWAANQEAAWHVEREQAREKPSGVVLDGLQVGG